MNFSLANMNATDYNTSKDFYENKSIISSVVFTICCIGVPLNGIVIWLLGFQIKRNPFTILILNLAIADFAFLTLMIISCIKCFIQVEESEILWKISFSVIMIAYINGLLLLTTISIDRCVVVLFPIWHRCSRPKYLSSAVCGFLWIFSFLLFGIDFIMQNSFLFVAVWNLYLVVTVVQCFPLITISTMILFIKICLKSKQLKRGRLLVMILITLLCFLIVTLPLYIYILNILFFNNGGNLFDVNRLANYISLSTSLNSSINPVIYFLVGRKKPARTRESIKVIFQSLPR